MNNKYIKLVALCTTFPTIMFGQQPGKPDATVTDRSNQPPAAVTTEGSETANVDASDAGAQRPIFLKTQNITPFAGLDSKYLYRNNPLSSSDKLAFIDTALWMNTAYAGASFNSLEIIDDAVITPYIGASYTSTEYLESGLDGLDFTSTSAYVMLLAQHSSGWTLRAGVSYAMDKSQASKEETYKELYPYIGAMKSHSLSDSVVGIFDISGGQHRADTDSFDSSYSGSKELENIDVTAAYSLLYIFNKIVVSPRYGITYKRYFYGPNDNREDLLHSVNLKIEYIVNENLNVSLFGGYSNRDSRGGTYQDAGTLSYDFESADGGLALGLNATF
jgi:hypothetical protein